MWHSTFPAVLFYVLCGFCFLYFVRVRSIYKYIYIYIFMCIYIYIYIFIYIYRYMYVCRYVHTYVCIYISCNYTLGLAFCMLAHNSAVAQWFELEYYKQ